MPEKRPLANFDIQITPAEGALSSRSVLVNRYASLVRIIENPEGVLPIGDDERRLKGIYEVLEAAHEALTVVELAYAPTRTHRDGAAMIQTSDLPFEHVWVSP